MSAGIAAPRRQRFGSGRIFGASVALNLFLAGLVGAHLVRGRLADAAPPDGSMIARITATLPPEEAKRFQSRLYQARAQYEPARDRIGLARRALAEAIAETPYDRASVQAALLAYQESWRSFFARFDPAFLDALGTLTPAGRASLVSAIEVSRPPPASHPASD